MDDIEIPELNLWRYPLTFEEKQARPVWADHLDWERQIVGQRKIKAIENRIKILENIQGEHQSKT
jgi:hypothetical protein